MGSGYSLGSFCGLIMIVIGVLMLLCAIPCRIWQALLGIVLAAAGYILFRKCDGRR